MRDVQDVQDDEPVQILEALLNLGEAFADSTTLGFLLLVVFAIFITLDACQDALSRTHFS
jgi:hypothetical protein